MNKIIYNWYTLHDYRKFQWFLVFKYLFKRWSKTWVIRMIIIFAKALELKLMYYYFAWDMEQCTNISSDRYIYILFIYIYNLIKKKKLKRKNGNNTLMLKLSWKSCFHFWILCVNKCCRYLDGIRLNFLASKISYNWLHIYENLYVLRSSPKHTIVSCWQKNIAIFSSQCSRET